MKKFAKINSLNEILLSILQMNTNKFITNSEIKQAVYHNSIGGLKLTEVDIRSLIKNLRFGGHPIIAGVNGYKYSTNKQELNEYINNRKLELESELLILKAMEGRIVK